MGKIGGNKGSQKYQIFKILKKFKPKVKIIPLDIFKKHSEELTCSLAYIGMQIRFAREAGYLRYDSDGDFVIDSDKPIKNWDVFCADLNVKANEARHKGGGTGSKRKPKIPENFVINEETVFEVLRKVFDDRKKHEEIELKMKKYIMMLKNDKEKLERALEDMVE